MKNLKLNDTYLKHLFLLRNDLYERGLFNEANEVHEKIGKLKAIK